VRYAALLRGINVGGNKKIAMAELRPMVESLGFTDAKTLLQSGNLVFTARAQSTAKLERTLEAATEKNLGVQCSYLVRDADEWEAIVAANPFPDMAASDPSHLALTVCREKPDAAALKALRAEARGDEELRAVGRELYIRYPDGMGESKLAIALSKNRLGTICTARNWNTVLKIASALA
jgi:uncharacterized protein (DUF1697 family)